MATKQFYATGAFRYQTRRLRAGDPIELDAPNARLFTALGKISPDKPKAAKASVPAMQDEEPEAPKPARKRKAATKRK